MSRCVMFSRVIVSICLTIGYFSAGTVSQLLTNQRSTFDFFTSDLAIDTDPTTCAKTGWDVGSWWKLDMGQPTIVHSVSFIGSVMSAFQIRVGNNSQTYGLQDGFSQNALCAYAPYPITTGTYSYQCTEVEYGRYVTIQSVDPIVYSQLDLCNVVIA